jgi:hypothetical protein
VPHFLYFLGALPTNANGKLDKDSLPDPFEPVSAPSMENRSPDSARVREAWESILGHAPASEDLNFFDAGGTSLEALQLQELVSKRFARELNPTFVFEYPTIKRQLEALGLTGSAEGQFSGRGEQRRNAGVRRARGGI